MTILKMPLFKKTGFTLLEMLIAILIFALMTSFLYFTFVTSERGTRLTLNSSKSYNEAGVIFRIMHRKLLEFNYIYPVFIGGKKVIGGKSFTDIYFSGFSHTGVPFNAKSSSENLNYFYVARMKGGGSVETAKKSKNRKKLYELIYRESYFKTVDGNITVQFKKIVIAKDVASFSVQYLFRGMWLDKFNYSQYGSPPESVKISAGLLSNGRVKKFIYRFNM